MPIAGRPGRTGREGVDRSAPSAAPALATPRGLGPSRVAKWLAKGWIPPSAAAFVNIVQADVHPPGPDSHAGNSPHSTLPSLTFLRPPAVGTSRRDGLANPLQSAFAVPLPPGQVDCGMCLEVTSRKVLELYSLWQPPRSAAEEGTST